MSDLELNMGGGGMIIKSRGEGGGGKIIKVKVAIFSKAEYNKTQHVPSITRFLWFLVKNEN